MFRSGAHFNCFILGVNQFNNMLCTVNSPWPNINAKGSLITLENMTYRKSYNHLRHASKSSWLKNACQCECVCVRAFLCESSFVPKSFAWRVVSSLFHQWTLSRVNQCKGQRGHPSEQLRFSQGIVQGCCLVLSRVHPPSFTRMWCLLPVK